jgi:hypothetical protein
MGIKPPYTFNSNCWVRGPGARSDRRLDSDTEGFGRRGTGCRGSDDQYAKGRRIGRPSGEVSSSGWAIDWWGPWYHYGDEYPKQANQRTRLLVQIEHVAAGKQPDKFSR